MIDRNDFEPADPSHASVTEALNRALAALGENYPRVAALTEARDAAIRANVDWRAVDAELQDARIDRYSLELAVNRLRNQQMQAFERLKTSAAYLASPSAVAGSPCG